MTYLERISPSGLRSSEPGLRRHGPCETLSRHAHDHAFAAMALSGAYVEAGDTGCHRVTPGDVLLHQAWESHLDRVDRCGAEVLVLRIAESDAMPVRGRLADPDAVARLAEDDPGAAARLLRAALLPSEPVALDWPDLLALALNDDPSLSPGDWAREQGLHPGSVSRGFRQVFGITPLGYRLAQRTRRALKAVRESTASLSLVALESGFADQAHMSRAIRKLAHVTPASLRRRGRIPNR